MNYFALLTLSLGRSCTTWHGTFTGPLSPEAVYGYLRDRAITEDQSWGQATTLFFGIWPAELP